MRKKRWKLAAILDFGGHFEIFYLAAWHSNTRNLVRMRSDLTFLSYIVYGYSFFGDTVQKVKFDKSTEKSYDGNDLWTR